MVGGKVKVMVITVLAEFDDSTPTSAHAHAFSSDFDFRSWIEEKMEWFKEEYDLQEAKEWFEEREEIIQNGGRVAALENGYLNVDFNISYDEIEIAFD